MKKNTKRFISSVVALSMAFSSAVTTSVAVSADDTATAAVDETVSAGAVTVEKSTLMAETSTFDASTLTAAADKEALTASELSAPFGVDGTVQKRLSGGKVTSVELGKALSGAILVTAKAGDTITVTVSSTGNSNTSSYGILDSNDTELLKGTVTGSSAGKKDVTYNVTADGTYKVVSPEDENNRGVRVYAITVGGESAGTVVTEETTQATTAAEETTQATTEAGGTDTEDTETPVKSSTFELKAADAGTAYTSGSVTLKTLQALQENKNDAGDVLSVKSSGVNNATVDGSKARALGVISSTADTSVVMKLNLSKGPKKGYVIESDTELGATADDPAVLDSKNAVVAIETTADDPYEGTKKFDVKEGKYYYLVAVGANFSVYSFAEADAGSATDETTEATTVAESTTTAEPTSQATTTAESTTTAEPTTQATTTAESTTTAEPTTQATTTATEASSETTTAKSSGGSGSGSARVKESDFKVEDTVSGTTFTSGTVTLTAAQNLKASGESLSGEGTNAKLNGETDANLWGVVASTVDTTVSLHLELAKGTIGYVIESESGDPATANLSTENAVWKVDTTGDTPQLMAAGDFDDYAVFDVKAGKYYYIVAEGSSGFAVSAFAEAEDIVDGEGVFKAADVKVKPGGTVDVVYKYEGTAFNNFTGFFEYDPSIGKLTDIKVEAKGATDTYTESFSKLCEQKITADTDIAGYKKEAGERLSALGAGESKTEAELGVVKVGTYFTVGEKNIDTSDVTVTLTFEANADAAEGADVKLAYVVYADARNTYNNIVDVSFDEVQITATASAGGVEDNQEVGEGTFTASDVEVKPGKTVDVVYNYDGAAFNNFTGFFKYDPSIGKLTGIKIEAKGDNGTYTGDFSELCTKAITADTDIKGYETEAAALAEGESKTEAELGKVKVGTYFTVDGKNIDTSDVTITLTFEANADAAEGATTTISYEEYAKARNTDNNIIKVSYGDAKITATENAVAQGAYSLSIPTEGVTKNADGTYTIGEDVTKFKVVVASDADFDITNFTVGLGFDPAYVKAVSGTGSDLVSDSVVSKAVAYTPTAANPDYAGKGADGVKTAGELGYIKLSNTTLFNADAAADAALAIDKEFLELKKGQTIAEFEFETVASTTTPTKITLTNIESTVLVGDPMVDPDFKYVVDEDKAWDISLNVAVKEPVTPPTPTTETVYYHLLGDVDHDNKIQAQDASIVYDYTLDDDKVEHAIDKNIAAVSDDVSVKDDGTVVLYAKDASAVYQKSLDDDYLYARTKDTYTEPNNANRSYAKVDVTGISEADVKTWTEKGTLVSVEVEKASETPAVQ